MSKVQRKRVLYSSPLVALAVLALLAWLRVDRVQARAQVLAQTGQGSIALLKELGAALEAGDLERAAACYSQEYASSQEVRWIRELASQRDGVRVLRWRAEAGAGPGATAGPEAALEQLAALLDGTEQVSLAQLKLARVLDSSNPDRPVISAVLWLRGESQGGELFETFLQLRMHLARAGNDAEAAAGGSGSWRIAHQELLSGETVAGNGQGFGDVAQAAGVDFSSHQNPLFQEGDWFPHGFGVIRFGSAGASAVDFDGDGWDDLFFADGSNPRLYRNRGDGTFEDATAAAGLPLEMLGVNVGLFVDLDNDGDRDAFFGVFTGPNRLFENLGDGTFREIPDPGLGGLMVTTAAAADYDLDGDLDLYVGRYLDPRVDLPTTMFYTRNGQGNSLLRNDGQLGFTDVTAQAGVADGGLTLGVSWADYDGDGDPDLYVANDFGRNALLENRGDGTFEDVSAATGTIDLGFGMSSSWGDPDGDGDFDIYVSNVHSGQRWYGQAATLDQYLITSLHQRTILQDYGLYREVFGLMGDDWRQIGEQMVKGNSLLVNDGGTFSDVAEAANTNPFGWYWGSLFFDYDNDGREDIYAANGWVTAPIEDDL